MGNPSTEAKKARKRKTRAKEIQKTRLYKVHGWDNLTPLDFEEVHLSVKLPKIPSLRRPAACYDYMNYPKRFDYGRCPGCNRDYPELVAKGHVR
jgi:hypothetical protein